MYFRFKNHSRIVYALVDIYSRHPLIMNENKATNSNKLSLM